MFDPYWQDETGYLRFEFFDGKVFAHSEINTWNKKQFIKSAAIWEEAKQELKQLGYKEIFICIPADNIKLIKFEKIFGFMPVVEKDNILIMVCNTEDLWELTQ